MAFSTTDKGTPNQTKSLMKSEEKESGRFLGQLEKREEFGGFLLQPYEFA